MYLDSKSFFENLPEFARPQLVADTMGLSIKTIYDWRYRAGTLKAPEGLFVKFNRILYIKTEILRKWIASQNSSLT